MCKPESLAARGLIRSPSLCTPHRSKELPSCTQTNISSGTRTWARGPHPSRWAYQADPDEAYHINGSRILDRMMPADDKRTSGISSERWK
ncbi:hypothetical protein L226DRAFT_248453 [Lentinus tigrinus ALCF2SS1-7]|uniref:Uncharacterized protein n=1 Tax=Lentinus tigrinus ALCF2SS1-6 TaxID=1328759 RepID=A0A5C2SPF9_9APHY|nr:hypothetical protein L227DRAFT_205028 [Lentinus tigrinus ALCF2SS1-6]RPD79378.1 hypothetical protein L226DRAFT_248453 [Lentinus tigrinus ALCF2SS1-7]